MGGNVKDGEALLPKAVESNVKTYKAYHTKVRKHEAYRRRKQTNSSTADTVAQRRERMFQQLKILPDGESKISVIDAAAQQLKRLYQQLMLPLNGNSDEALYFAVREDACQHNEYCR